MTFLIILNNLFNMYAAVLYLYIYNIWVVFKVVGKKNNIKHVNNDLQRLV